MPRNKRYGEYELTPEQQQIVDDGLRILARMIARRVMQEQAHDAAHAADGEEGRR